jgi:energy-coupling factor transporter transmembrane protein EcfT
MPRKFHPLCVLAGTCCLFICSVFARNSASVACLFLLTAVLIVGQRLNTILVLKRLLKFWPYVALTAGIIFVLNGGLAGTSINHLKFFVKYDALPRTALPVSRFVLLIILSIALFELHAPERYGRAVGYLLSRIPAGRSLLAQLDLVMSLALRFVPFLWQEHQRIEMALTARGMTEKPKLRGRLERETSILYPLFISAMRRADHVAAALAARGYDPRVARTSLTQTFPRRGDTMWTGLFIMLCVIVVCL